MIRVRARLRNKIRAVSTEGPISAMIMATIPMLLCLMILTLMAIYFDPVWNSGYGTTVVVSLLALIKTLRVISKEMRETRLLMAEEKANALSVERLFPMANFLFPVNLTIVLVPIMMQIIALSRPCRRAGCDPSDHPA